MLRRHLTYANAGVTLLLILGVTGLAVASTPVSNGVIHGCYQKTTGTLRVIKGNQKCNPKSEVATSWNQQGVAGVPGQTGPKGAAGAPGRPG